jgi:hypothetical protein
LLENHERPRPKSYIETQEKGCQDEQHPPNEENNEPSENDSNYEEAKKLAEKYY